MNNIKNIFKDYYKKTILNNGFIDIIKFANNLNIDVFGADLKDKTSYIQYNNENGKYEIYVNFNHTKERQRFSIAHEIGHFILHRDLVSKQAIGRQDCDLSLSYKEEARADKFAAKLLMPTRAVFNFLNTINVKRKGDITTEILYNFMSKFKVSKPCAILRLRDLQYVTGQWLW